MKRLALITAVVVLAGCGAASRESRPPSATTASTTSTTSTTSATSAATSTEAKPRSNTTTMPPPATTAPDTLRLISEPGEGIAPIDNLLASPRRTLDMTMYELVDPTAESILAADDAGL